MSLTETDSQNEIVNSQDKMRRIWSRLLMSNPLGAKTEPTEQKVESPVSSSPKENESCQTYYGVYIPCESKISPEEEILLVYKNASDALKIVKKYKKARFKAFKNHHDAVAFALQGIEPASDKEVGHNGDSLLPENGPSQTNSAFIGGEKPSQFKGPKPQEMVAFRKTIEAGDLESVKKTVWDNPRYLVSSGDTPSILQEGSRYNALHVAVKAKNPQMCDYILSTVSDPQFVQLLYGDDNIDSCKERASILLDLYLNTPDKAINETPLHFAVKFGAKDVVDLLVSYPQCHRNRINKRGEQPKDIICQRCEGDENLINEIASMLDERYYVPVLHSEDDTRQPVIGEPFSPGSPPLLNDDPISPRMEIRAFAGPMNKIEADTFRKKWKTPPRSLPNSIYKTHIAEARFRLQDIEKGLEKVGRGLAQELKIGWKEYWPFLDTFTDLASMEGLGLLEDYLKNKFTSQWNNSSSNESFADSLQMTPKTPTERPKDPRKNVESPVKTKNVLSPMSDLCATLKSLTINSANRRNSPNFPRYHKTSDPRPAHEDDSIVNTFLNPGLNPYLCVEKSCQVFAKRLALGFSHAFTSENEHVVECLRSEMKHLQQTISSYTDDVRFNSVDFHLLHARVAQLVAQKLKFDSQFVDDVNVLRKELSDVCSTSPKTEDPVVSSDEDDGVFVFRQPSKKYNKSRKRNVDMIVQIKCIAKSILKWLSDEYDDSSQRTLKTEEECLGTWSNLQKCNCSWQTAHYSRINRKSASFKRNLMKSEDGFDILSSSPKSTIETVSKKLIFEGDETNHITSLDEMVNCKNDRNQNLPVKTIIQDPDELFKDVYSSDDEAKSGSEEENFFTPNSSDISDNALSDFEDADDYVTSHKDLQRVYVFIHGDKPTKTDKLVYDVICNQEVDFTKYPYVYRWRHTVSLYSNVERESWPLYQQSPVAELDSPITYSFNIGYIPNFDANTPNQRSLKNIYTVKLDENLSPNPSRNNGSVINPITLITPTKNNMATIKNHSMMSPKPSMQVSKWMRVTGPNSPRSSTYKYIMDQM